MKSLLLGVNGGASNTEFLLTDLSGKDILTFTINRGINPWHCGVHQTEQVLRKGFGKLGNDHLQNIAYAYLGISGCFGDSKHNSEIETFISQFLPKFTLAGDLYSSFRAVSKHKHGLLAIAGSGSSIASFSTRGTFFFDGPAFGGRDFGYMLVKQLQKGHLDSKLHLKDFLEEQFENSKILNESNLLQKDTLPEVLKLSNAFGKLENDSKVIGETDIYLDLVIDRWVYKIASYIEKYRDDLGEEYDLVLSGGFWKLEYIRKNVIAEVKQFLPKLNVLYSENVRPVRGCVRIARESLNVQ
ncbi:MAG: hypothetical protein PHS44_06885 [Candidatus Dojkabacteria bacterium]|nr:hypothetical protein [Candidatus Dojkabacteria bacterium]